MSVLSVKLSNNFKKLSQLAYRKAEEIISVPKQVYCRIEISKKDLKTDAGQLFKTEAEHVFEQISKIKRRRYFIVDYISDKKFKASLINDNILGTIELFSIDSFTCSSINKSIRESYETLKLKNTEAAKVDKLKMEAIINKFKNSKLKRMLAFKHASSIKALKEFRFFF